MTREIRSHRAGSGRDGHRPLYARVLGLQYVNPGGMLCFIYFEGMIALAVLLALTERVSWWAVLVLPAAVAVMVKVNDVVAGALVQSGAVVSGRSRRVVGRAAVTPAPISPAAGGAPPGPR